MTRYLSFVQTGRTRPTAAATPTYYSVAMSSVDAMGPGTPTPVSYSPRQVGTGKQLQYSAKAGQIAADVGKSTEGANMNAQFQPRPPVTPPGGGGIGQKGSFVDASA